jgi:hypothetical protein
MRHLAREDVVRELTYTARIFSAEEALAYGYLAELVEGNAAIFVGAGLSVPAGYVDWRALLRPLLKDLDLNIVWRATW